MAAKVKASTSITKIVKPRVKRKGVHAKTKQSKNKSSVNYKKSYVGQGR